MTGANPDFTGPLKPGPGHNFEFIDDSMRPIDEVRQMLRERLQREAHIKVRIGPFSMRGSKIDAQVEAIDDKYLDGNFSMNLAKLHVGSVIYIGYLK